MKQEKIIYEAPMMDVLLFEMGDVVTLSYTPGTSQNTENEAENFEDIFG